MVRVAVGKWNACLSLKLRAQTDLPMQTVESVEYGRRKTYEQPMY